MELKMGVDALNNLMHSKFLQVAKDFVVERVKSMVVCVPVAEQNLRPGGIISGLRGIVLKV